MNASVSGQGKKAAERFDYQILPRSLMLARLACLVVSAWVFCSGCSSTHRASGFLESYRRLQEGNHFRQEYVAPGVNFGGYSKVQILPPDSDYLYQDKILRQDQKAEQARRFVHTLERRLSKDFILLSPAATADEHTLIIRTVFTELTPSKKWVPSFGANAFEAKIMHGQTKEVLAEVAEKRSGWAFKHWAKSLKQLLHDYSY